MVQFIAVQFIHEADDDAPPLFAYDLPPDRFASPLNVKEVAVEVPAAPSRGPGCTAGR